MKPEHAQAIFKAAQEIGLEDEVKMHESYCARCRGDRTTFAVTGPFGSCIKAIAAAAVTMALADPEKADEFVEDMELAMDNMGRRDVILY